MITCIVLIASLVCTSAAVGYVCTLSWDAARMFLLSLFICFFKLEKTNESYPCTVNTTLFLLFFARYLFCPFRRTVDSPFPC